MTKSEKRIVFGLILLSLVPLIAGIFRVTQLATGAEITQENTRFFEQPFPLVLHVICSLLFCLLAPFQFTSTIRTKHLKLHRASGKVLVISGLFVAVSGLWMTQFYPWVNYDGLALYLVRLMVSIAMIVFICLGLYAILKRKFPSHQAWMMRAYALSLGAGTQVFTHIPLMFFPAVEGELSRTIAMTFGWIINIIAVEIILSRVSKKTSTLNLFWNRV